MMLYINSWISVLRPILGEHCLCLYLMFWFLTTYFSFGLSLHELSFTGGPLLHLDDDLQGEHVNKHVNITLNPVKLANNSEHFLHNHVIRWKHTNLLFHLFLVWHWLKKTTKKTWLLDVQTEAAAGFVSAWYRNCTVNKPVSVYTEDKSESTRFTFSIAGCQIIVLFRIKVWAAWFYLVLTTRRHSSLFFIVVALLLLDPSALLKYW